MTDTSDDEPIAKKRRTQPKTTAERYDAIVRHRLKRESEYPANANTKGEDVEIPSAHPREPATKHGDQVPEDSTIPNFPTDNYYQFCTPQQKKKKMIINAEWSSFRPIVL